MMVIKSAIFSTCGHGTWSSEVLCEHASRIERGRVFELGIVGLRCVVASYSHRLAAKGPQAAESSHGSKLFSSELIGGIYCGI
jgi:hypothetical protein